LIVSDSDCGVFTGGSDEDDDMDMLDGLDDMLDGLDSD